MQQLNSSMFKETYKKLGIDTNKLGCIMLNVEPIGNIWTIEEQGAAVELYYSPNKDLFWINGWVADKTPHITLLYGLLEGMDKYKSEVLQDWDLKEVEIDHIGFFDSTFPDEPYYCIIAHIKVTPELMEGHQRLEFLPHINTFAGYKPHVTIAYIKKNELVRDEIIKNLNELWKGKKLKVSGFFE